MSEKEFWTLIRRALLMIAAAIFSRFLDEKKKLETTKPEVTNVSTDYFEKP